MRRKAFWDEFHVIPGTLPQKTAFAKQVMNLKRMTRVQADRTQIYARPTRLSVKTVEIHDDDNYVRKIVSCLAVTQESWIIGFMELQVAIALQRRVALPDVVYFGDKILQATGILFAVPKFILLGIQILFLTGFK